MKKKMISKILLLLITLTLIVCISPKVYAENNITDDDNIPDLMNQINGGNTATGSDNNTTTGNNTATGSENNTTTGNNTSTGSGNNTTVGNNTSTSTKNNTTSSYEETKIPYAGPAETILMSVAFIVCAIIGIYTFMKLSEYSNI